MIFKLESPPTGHPRQQRGDVGRRGRWGGGGIAQWCMLISPKYPCSSCTISVATPVATVLSTCFSVSLLTHSMSDPHNTYFPECIVNVHRCQCDSLFFIACFILHVDLSSGLLFNSGIYLCCHDNYSGGGNALDSLGCLCLGGCGRCWMGGGCGFIGCTDFKEGFGLWLSVCVCVWWG